MQSAIVAARSLERRRQQDLPQKPMATSRRSTNPPLPGSSNPKPPPVWAAYAGAGLGAALEQTLFFPIDTASKRLQTHTSATPLRSFGRFKNAVLQGKTNLSPMQTIASLYSGIQAGLIYKLIQRPLKHGTQDWAKRHLDSVLTPVTDQYLSQKQRKTLVSTMSGAGVGVLEVGILPIDYLKVRFQTQPEYMKKHGILGVVRKHGLRNMYTAAKPTAFRNFFGSAFFYGGNTMAEQLFFAERAERGEVSVPERAAAAMFGSALSIMGTAPLDTIKTRMQSNITDQSCSAMQTARQLYQEAGVRGFFRGAGLKTLTIGPKMAFSLAVTQVFIDRFVRQAGSSD